MEDSPHAVLPPAAKSPTSWIDRLSERFERGWRSDERPNLEDYLAEVLPSHREEILKELLAIEIEIRRVRGEEVDRGEYLRRFPDDVATIDHVWQGRSRALAETRALAEPGTTPNAACTATRYAELTLYRRGGLGVLWRARDEDLHRDVVIKFIHEKCRGEAELLNQFRVEAEVTGRLDHPGVVPVYGIGQDWNGQPFYVMRMIHGRELRQAIHEYHEAGGPANGSRENRQRLFTLLEHLASACNTVAYAHDVGIVHCDLKPANIMIGKYGETFVLDWGLATQFERTSTFFATNEPTMRPRSADSSHSGQRGGTVGYISPEQLSSTDRVMPTSDVYSLGATLYELMCGRAPFSGHDPDVVDQIRRGNFRRPREVNQGVPRGLQAICLKAMSLAPAERYRTAKLMAADLKNWMRDDEVQASPDNVADRVWRLARRHRAVTLASILSLLLVTAAGIWARLSSVHAVQEEHLRANIEAIFNDALNTFEDLCQPLADGEMSNLRVFQPLTRRIQEFTEEYLKRFANNRAMRPHTARLYALRATVARIGRTGDARAIDDYQQAAAILDELVAESSDSDYSKRLALVRLSEGRILLQRRDLQEAREKLVAARDRFQRLVEGEPNDRKLQRSLAEAFHSLGEVGLRVHEFGGHAGALNDAEDAFDEAKTLRESLFNSSHGAEQRDYKRDLARSFGYLGDLHMAEGKVNEARKDYETSLPLRKGLSRDDPNPENRFQYARGLVNFGALERDFGGDRENLGAAIQMLEEARVEQERLVDQFPEVASFHGDLISTLNLLAELHLFASLDDAAHGNDHVRAAMAYAQKAASKFDSSQTDATSIREIATSLVLQAVAQRIVEPQEFASGVRQTENFIKEKLEGEVTLDADSLFVLALARALSDGQTKSKAWQSLTASLDRGQNAVARFERHRELGFRSLTASPEGQKAFEAMLRELSGRVVTE